MAPTSRPGPTPILLEHVEQDRVLFQGRIIYHRPIDGLPVREWIRFRIERFGYVAILRNNCAHLAPEAQRRQLIGVLDLVDRGHIGHPLDRSNARR